jgi:hypothetical protein
MSGDVGVAGGEAQRVLLIAYNSPMPTQTLSRRALNRALLARQFLLARETTTPLRAVERLVGLQAQEARPPFIGLWSRLVKFARGDLTRLVHDRRLVRATAMRATIHLMRADDFVALRPALQPALTGGMKSVLGGRADGLDLADLVARSRRHFDAAHCTFESLRDHFERCGLGGDLRALAYVVRTHLPLVQVPADDAPWGFPPRANFATAEAWLKRTLAAEARPDELILRYLGAFGPAAPADAQNWSGLRGLGEAFARLRPGLRTFRDEQGRELFDLPRAPRPSPDVPAPVRFLPEFDSLVLGHGDRTRVIADADRRALVTKNLRVPGTFLLDGFVAGTWKIQRAKHLARLVIQPFDALPKKLTGELNEEATALLRFAESDARAFEVSRA